MCRLAWFYHAINLRCVIALSAKTKKLLLLLVLSSAFYYAQAQLSAVDNLKQQLKNHPQKDTFRVNRWIEFIKIDTLTPKERAANADEMLEISQKSNYLRGEAYALVIKGYDLVRDEQKARGLELIRQSLRIAGSLNDDELLARTYYTAALSENAAGDNKSSLADALKAETIAQKLANKKILITIQIRLANLYSISLSDYPKAMEWGMKAAKTAEDFKAESYLAEAWGAMASVYGNIGDQANALLYYKKALDLNKKLGVKTIPQNILVNIGEVYRLSGNYPQALKYYEIALAKTKGEYNIGLNKSNMADVYVRTGDLQKALKYAFDALAISRKLDDAESISWVDGIIARAYIKQHKIDSAIYYGKDGFENGTKTGTLEFIRDNTEALANAYALKKDFANAYKYHKLFVSYRDSMLNTQVTSKVLILQYNADLQKKQVQIGVLNQEKKLQNYFLIGAMVVLGLIVLTVIVLIRNNRQKQKANNLLQKQKHIIEEQRDETNKALADLKLTQTQLVQSEKMASLGELTAGIAHEIQNPLNFINNFSEVNTELIDEMQEAIDHKNYEELSALAADVKGNQQKISHHGKRADFIVKGMLQHSRNNTGERQLTNINTLADEFFKLSYHGLRAKNKSFNAELVTSFDAALPKMNVISQDIGRVLLNMFNNAFYAVDQKQKTAGSGYKPTVSVTTLAADGYVIIKVQDNGNGISESVKDKIMQPFFTTKPTGQGTGLGLSLSYDIVVKGHGGKIDVISNEGEFSEFVVTLPIS